MKHKLISKLWMVLSIVLILTGCNEGEDASLFNGVNELEITGTIGMVSSDFDHNNVVMIVHLFNNSDFSGTPVKRLSLNWYEQDEQNNLVAIDETSKTFLNAVSPGDYYAYGFIDLNKNSEVDTDEPYDVWLNQDETPKVIPVKEESRWAIDFLFDRTYVDD